MTTQVYRVSRVHIGTSPVARIDAVNAAGHDLRLEVERDLARGAAPGRLLVLQWTMHDAPAASDTSASTTTATPDESTRAATTSEASSKATEVRPDPAAVDQEFMEMMVRGRKPAASSPAAQGRSIDRELSTLLGGAGAKGQK